MSNIIPPLISNSPPPIVGPLDEEDDDDFGDFRGAHEMSYSCDNLSLPSSPFESPKKSSPSPPDEVLDINSNKNKQFNEKDHLDRRKDGDILGISEALSTKPVEKFENSTNSDLKKQEHLLVIKPIVDGNCINNLEPKKSSVANLALEQEISDLEVEYINNVVLSTDPIPQPQFENDAKITLENGCDDSLSCSDELSKERTVNSTTTEDEFGEFLKPSDIPDIKPVDNDSGRPNSAEFVNAPDKEESESFAEFMSSEEVSKSCDNLTDDDFGNFETAGFENVTNITGNVAIEDFGSFECPAKESILAKVNETVEDDFGQFPTPEIDVQDKIKSYVNESVPETDMIAENVVEHEDFGNFETAVKKSNAEPTNRVIENAVKDDGFTDFQIDKITENVMDDDDFADFETPQPDSNVVEDDDFGNFETTVVTTLETFKTKDDDDDFGDFETATWDTKPEVKDVGFTEFATTSTSDADNFGNFANFDEPSLGDSVVLTLDKENIFEKTESILKDIFPCTVEVPDEVYVNEITQGDSVFDELKDVTETNALIYQWSKSASQGILLRSLNIDTRNILYGPAWNSSMPIFAANLGLTPLEPIKPEVITPTPVQKVEINPSNSSQSVSTNSEIPSAQFDWTGSGLINPLDSVSAKDETVAKVETPTKSPIVEFESTSLSGKPQSSVEFTSLNTPSWSNIVPVPLRETHISNDDTQMVSDNSADTKSDFGWLQPTIVTPELPRKDIIQDEDDDFDDFQVAMALESKIEKIEPTVLKTVKNIEPMTMTPIQTPSITTSYRDEESSVDDFDVFGEFESKTCSVEPISQSEPHINTTTDVFSEFQSSLSDKTSQVQISSINTIVTPITVNNVEEKCDDEDDFTDFHSSLPPSQPLQTVPLEPLQPAILTPQIRNQTMQINWPDPGISDDDIKRFEMSFNTPLDNSIAIVKAPKTEPIKSVPQPTIVDTSPKSRIVTAPPKLKPISKEKSLEEDEWSDFVSVQQQPSPLHKINFVERTASPDLPLSVLNLGNIQPTRQPIPVITPQGLMQTKLSSNQVPAPKQSTYYNQQSTAITNSLISNQYASAHLFNSIGFPMDNTPQVSQVQNNLEDDDWSDFISNPIPQTNGYSDKPKVQSFPNPSPNIITNPSHFHGYQGPKMSTISDKTKNSSVQSKSTIPSISTLPDLDFIAPKGWTNRK